MWATSEFCKGTSMSSACYSQVQYNSPVYGFAYILSVQAQFTHATGFCVPFL